MFAADNFAADNFAADNGVASDDKRTKQELAQ
jgi:hypothetical protein